MIVLEIVLRILKIVFNLLYILCEIIYEFLFINDGIIVDFFFFFLLLWLGLFYKRKVLFELSLSDVLYWL